MRGRKYPRSGTDIQEAWITLTIAQVLTLNTSPIVWLPQVDGYVYNGEYAIFHRHAEPYLTEGGAIQLRTQGSSTLLHSSATNVKTVAGDANGATAGGKPGGANGGLYQVGGLFWGNKAVEIFNATANPTVNAGANPGSPMTIGFYYRLVPVYLRLMGNP